MVWEKKTEKKEKCVDYIFVHAQHMTFFHTLDFRKVTGDRRLKKQVWQKKHQNFVRKSIYMFNIVQNGITAQTKMRRKKNK